MHRKAVSGHSSIQDPAWESGAGDLWSAMAGVWACPPLSSSLSEDIDCTAGLPKQREKGPEVSEGSWQPQQRGPMVQAGQLWCKAQARGCVRILPSKGSLLTWIDSLPICEILEKKNHSTTACREPSGLRLKKGQAPGCPFWSSVLEQYGFGNDMVPWREGQMLRASLVPSSCAASPTCVSAARPGGRWNATNLP